MSKLAQQRCAHHEDREAAARCPECGRFFCRECVTEHQGRLFCVSCLRKISNGARRGAARFRWFLWTAQILICFVVVWLFFYLSGRVLASLPTSFHEGTLWREEEE